MDDADEPKEVPCPTCAEPSNSTTEPCELCRQEDDALKLTEHAKSLARRTAEKFPALKPFEGMGYDA